MEIFGERLIPLIVCSACDFHSDRCVLQHAHHIRHEMRFYTLASMTFFPKIVSQQSFLCLYALGSHLIYSMSLEPEKKRKRLNSYSDLLSDFTVKHHITKRPAVLKSSEDQMFSCTACDLRCQGYVKISDLDFFFKDRHGCM